MPIGMFANQKIYIHGYDRSGIINQVNIEARNEVQDCTSINDTTRIYLAGLNDIDFSVEGFYDYVADDIDWNLIGTDNKIISFFESGGAATSIGYSIPATITEYNPSFRVGELRAFRISAKSSQKFVKVMTPDGKVTINASGEGTARQIGAVASDQKLYSFVHILAASGTDPTLIIKIRSDDNPDFTSPISRLTHTTFTDIGAEVKSADGPITDTWYKTQYTVGGTNPSFEAIVGIGIV